jgi:hypothetical protein
MTVMELTAGRLRRSNIANMCVRMSTTSSPGLSIGRTNPAAVLWCEAAEKFIGKSAVDGQRASTRSDP